MNQDPLPPPNQLKFVQNTGRAIAIVGIVLYLSGRFRRGLGTLTAPSYETMIIGVVLFFLGTAIFYDAGGKDPSSED